MLVATTVLAAVSAAASVGEYILVERELHVGPISDALWTMSDAVQNYLGAVWLLVLSGTAFAFTQWVYRASRNLRQFGAQKLRFSPRWAAGYFYVPVYGLWRPYQAMREIWQASEAEDGASPIARAAVRTPKLLPWWWSFYLLMNYTGFRVLGATLRAETLPDYSRVAAFSAMQDVFTLVAAILAVAVIRNIEARQARRLGLT